MRQKIREMSNIYLSISYVSFIVERVEETLIAFTQKKTNKRWIEFNFLVHLITIYLQMMIH